MLTDILDKLRVSASNDDRDNRRVYPRRNVDSCVGIINGKAYPVENWSDGGVLINGDDKLFSLNDNTDLTLKFKLSGKILDIPHKGTIVRKARNKFAVKFAPLSREVSRKFQHVLDDYVTREFADSQMV